MTIYVPWGLIAIFIAFYIFREHNRIRRLKREERSENIRERKQALIDQLTKSKAKKKAEADTKESE